MDILTIFLRTVMIYFVILLMMRIMGKREIGKLSVFDLVISILIAEIATFVIEDPHKPFIEGILPMVTLVVIQIIIAWISLKSQTLRLWIDGKSSMIIEHGKLNREEMRKQKYSLDDLMLQLRENRVMNVADVEFAILEPTGKLTVERKQDFHKNKADKDRNVQIRYEGLPLPLILDGKVQDSGLEKIGQTRFWLKNELQATGVTDFKEVFFCSIDHRGQLFVDKKRK